MYTVVFLWVCISSSSLGALLMRADVCLHSTRRCNYPFRHSTRRDKVLSCWRKLSCVPSFSKCLLSVVSAEQAPLFPWTRYSDRSLGWLRFGGPTGSNICWRDCLQLIYSLDPIFHQITSYPARPASGGRRVCARHMLAYCSFRTSGLTAATVLRGWKRAHLAFIVPRKGFANLDVPWSSLAAD